MIKQIGLSLMEALVSLVIISFMLLSLDALQINTLRQAEAAYYFSVATQQLSNIAARLKTWPGVDHSKQFTLWVQQNQEVLPNGRGFISGQYPHYQISILWGAALVCEHDQIGQSGCLKMNIDC